VIRERTYTHLLIGLVLSLLIHAYIVMWGPPFSMPTPTLRPPPEVEVQLREWPTLPPASPSLEAVKMEEPPAAKPVLPPNTQALQDAVQTALTPVRPLADVAELPDLPAPEHQRAETKALPPLPTLAAPARRESAPTRPATIALPSPQVTSLIKGPASERQVIFQPPPPSVTVESESEIELRFWILPNGAVGRVVPVKKSDPRLEALVINYLRHWRFTPLPPDSLQDEQWGIIPFKFRIR
jgi:TonB family protein